MAIAYRIARLLLSPTLKLFGLAGLLARAVEAADAANGPAGEKTPPDGGQTPELFAENGLWGYRCGERVVVAPLYDCGFDFSEGLAAVRLGRTWHYIDPAGVTRLSLPGCEAGTDFPPRRSARHRPRGARVRSVPPASARRQAEDDAENFAFGLPRHPSFRIFASND